MSFYIVIYSSLGMSAFWEIVEKIVKIIEICRFFSGGRWDWIWAPFFVDFGTILGAVGRQSRKKGDPESLTKSHGKKVTQVITEDPEREGGVPLNNPHSTPGHHDKDPLNTL